MSAANSWRLSTPQFAGQQQIPVDLETVDCLLCGGLDYETVVITHDPLTQIGGNFRVVRCRNCQLAFTNPRPTERDRGLFYPADYAPHLQPDSAADSYGGWRRTLEHSALRSRYGYPPPIHDARTAFRSVLARAVFRRRRDRQHWIPFRAPGRLLDFGCGADDFLPLMRSYGWHVEGLDLFPQVVEALRLKAGIRAHLGSLPHPDICPGSFDAITMRHSLEHVPFPKEVLRAAAVALANERDRRRRCAQFRVLVVSSLPAKLDGTRAAAAPDAFHSTDSVPHGGSGRVSRAVARANRARRPNPEIGADRNSRPSAKHFALEGPGRTRRPLD